METKEVKHTPETDETKSCPFCGSSRQAFRRFEHIESQYQDTEECGIHCLDCDAMGPTDTVNLVYKNGIVANDWEVIENDSWRKWNEQATAAERDKLKEEVEEHIKVRSNLVEEIGSLKGMLDQRIHIHKTEVDRLKERTVELVDNLEAGANQYAFVCGERDQLKENMKKMYTEQDIKSLLAQLMNQYNEELIDCALPGDKVVDAMNRCPFKLKDWFNSKKKFV